jgi:hypothetical protein
MFKELTLQNIWESEMPVENGSTFKFKSTLWWPTLVEGLSSGLLKFKRLFYPYLSFSMKPKFSQF